MVIIGHRMEVELEMDLYFTGNISLCGIFPSLQDNESGRSLSYPPQMNILEQKINFLAVLLS